MKTSLLTEFNNAFSLVMSGDANLYKIIGLSLFVSLSATTLASLVALPVGAWISIKKFPLKNSVISLLNALTGLPPVVLGLIVYILLSRNGPLGHWGILYTPTAMILTQTLLIFPIIAAQVRNLTQETYNTTAPYYKMLGMSDFQIVPSILFEMRFVVSSAIMAGLGRALSEVGAMLIVGGNINEYTRVMTTAISLETGKGNLGFALALGIVLLSIILILNHITTMVNAYAQKNK